MNRGEVWRITLGRRQSSDDPNLPGELSRNVVILSSDALAILPLRVVVPLTPWKEEFASAPWLVRVPPVLNSGLEQVMAADALQVRSVSTSRLKERLGDLPDRLVAEISRAVAGVILN